LLQVLGRTYLIYGKDDATLDEITRAAKLSEALSFINNLPERFETQVLASFIAIVNDGYTKTRMQVDYGKPETNKILYDLL
jgi:ABC-type transport system involved in Fe-S cluster assembly fused permease/ATPase subunit